MIINFVPKRKMFQIEMNSKFVIFPFQAQPNLQLNSAGLVKPVILCMKDQWNIIDAEMNKTNFITLISPAD
jgi:hypothetical protein